MELITSLQNPRVKQAAKLRDRRERHRLGRFLIDGARELLRALEAGVELEAAFVCQELGRSKDFAATLAMLRDSRPQLALIGVSPAVFGKLAYGDRAEGVMAVAITPQTDLSSIPLNGFPLVCVLEGVEKPGNVGAVLRTADAAGLSGLIAAGGGTDLYNPNVVRASLGALFAMPVASAGTSETVAWLRTNELQIVAARVDAPRSYAETDYRRPTAIVLGSEDRGLSDAWLANDIISVRLPMRGRVDSLNVSATAAVLFYEALRQRGAT